MFVNGIAFGGGDGNSGWGGGGGGFDIIWECAREGAGTDAGTGKGEA